MMKLSSVFFLFLFFFSVFGFPNYPGTCLPNAIDTNGIHTNPTAPDTAGTLTIANASGSPVTKYYVGGATYVLTFQTTSTIGGFLFFVTNSVGSYVGSWTLASGQQTTGTIIDNDELVSGSTTCLEVWFSMKKKLLFSNGYI